LSDWLKRSTTPWGLGRVVAGPDVLQLDPLGDEPGEAEALEGRAVEFPIDFKLVR